MKKNVVTTITVLVFSLVGIILGNKSFAFEDNNSSVWNVYFDNIKVSKINGTAFVPNDPEISGTSIKAFDILVSKKGDYATFTFDVVNAGSVDAKLTTLTKIEPKCISLEIPGNTNDEELVCNNLEYKYYYTNSDDEVNINDVVKANSKKNITIKVGVGNNLIDDFNGDVQITLFDSTFAYNK